MKAAKPRIIEPSERDIQKAGREFLALDDWRLIITDNPRVRGLAVQEKGMGDDWFIRYNPVSYLLPIQDARRSDADVINIEWKRRTGKAMAHQMDWHERERARGALTWIAGIDFAASIEGFIEKYMESGLARKVRG